MGGKTGLYEVGIPIKENTKKGYKMAYPGDSIDLGYANLNTRRGRVGHEIAHTLTTESQQGTVHFVDLSVPPLVTEHARCLNTRQDSSIHKHNGNSFRLGVSGSGKSFSAKEEIVDLALSTEDDILILDPESEFGSLVEALNGEVIKISATSDTHLNAMDMDSAYGNDKNPLIEKSEFILSLFEQLVGAGNLSAKEKSILDRCTADVYRDYIRNGYQGQVPTLKDLYRQLMLQPEEEARGLALSSELFINGSLNTFAQPTNVNTKSRIIAYDIRELGEQLMPLGMLVTLDSIFNRVIQNWKMGKTTWIFADEFYLLFRYEYSADFFYRLYKRIRKYSGFVTGLTQNVEELLKSDTARLMLANSEFLILLNQATTDRDELANLLNISDNQLSYITNVGAGHGLIRCSGNIVPFENSFPKNTALYRLMTTKPGEAQGLNP